MDEALKIGIAGLGTVGVGVVEMLRDHGDKIRAATGRSIEITGVTARDAKKDRGVDLSGAEWFSDPVALARSQDIDVFVELIGGEDGPAHDAVEAAMTRGLSVITANKALLAVHGKKFAELAEAHNAPLYYEAAVAGGIPVVKTLRESVVANQVNRIAGILNGTCNYILTVMEREGRAFEDVLADAQAKGYAEADPTFDIGGFDAAHKLAILTSLAFGTHVSFDDAYVEGIESVSTLEFKAAEELGYRLKLLGVAQKTDSGIEQRVHLAMVPIEDPIAGVSGVSNCVQITGDFVGDIMLVGPGAGRGATASAVLSDLVDVAREGDMPPFIVPASKLAPFQRAGMRTHEGGYYIRLFVYDRPGGFASIASRMSEHGVSLASIVQRELKDTGGSAPDAADDGASAVPVILITHETTETAIRDALSAIEADNSVAEQPIMIRIEGA